MTQQTPRTLGTRKQLLFDDALVEEKRGFTLTMNPATPTEAPVLVPEKPWEQGGIAGVSVVEGDDGEFKMWYRAYSNAGVFACYATSADGIHWERPELGLVEFAGSQDNNIVAPHWHGSVFKDPHDIAERRYKFIGEGKAKWPYLSVYGGGARFRYAEEPPATWHYNAVIGAHSPDGIHWTECPEPIMPWYTDCVNAGFWDDRIQRYVAYVRWNEYLRVENNQQVGSFDYRAIGRAETTDFAHFPEPAKIEEPDFNRPEDEDLIGAGLYSSAATKYPDATDAYFIFTAAFYHTSDTLDCQVATSRDGVQFHRWREPFVRLGPAGSFDSCSIYMGAGMLPAGDELYLYYAGGSRMHDQKKGEGTPASIGRVRVRRDGFVSQDAAAERSWLKTIPFVIENDRLEVNMDASARGGLKVEILAEAGHPIFGYSASDADRLERNELAQTATWNGSADLSPLRGRTVRLRFIGESVKLYAFQLVEG